MTGAVSGAASPATDPVAEALKAGIRVYQYTLRPFIGAHCRFHPHCSAYAIEALSGHGALRGTAMAARRILRCHPWNPGGYDPVPTPRGSEAQGSETRGPIPTPPMQPPRGH